MKPRISLNEGAALRVFSKQMPGHDIDDRTRLTRIRVTLLLFLWLGTAGMLVELLLIGHYEDVLQWTPLAIMALSLVLLSWHARTPTAGVTRALTIAMMLLIAAAGLGVVFHYQGAREFQREVDPSLSGFSLFWKTIRAKAPPALAPMALAGLGLAGFAYTLTTRRS